MTEKPTGKTRGRKKKKSILEEIIHQEDFPKFRVWSDLIDRTPPFQNIKPEKFWKTLEKSALNLYEEYGGNGRHRRLEKILSLPVHSLRVHQPTSLQTINGRFFIVPLPPNSQQQNEKEKGETRVDCMKWWEQTEQWLALRDFNWGQAVETEVEKDKNKVILLERLDEWEEQDLFQLERLLSRLYDYLTNEGEFGREVARDCLWIATTEPGFLFRQELRQWFCYMKVPSFRTPRWKDCYDILQEEIPNVLTKDPWIHYLNNMYQGETNEIKVYYPQKFFVELYFVEEWRLRIRLQTTRKREFSWRQFWNEMQLLIYMLRFRIQEPNIQRFQWYLFAPNQFQFISSSLSLNP